MTKPSAITDGATFDITTVDRELRSADAYKLDGHTAADAAFPITLARGE